MRFELGRYLKDTKNTIAYTTAIAIASASFCTATPAFAQNPTNSNQKKIQISHQKSQLESKLDDVKLEFYVVKPKDEIGKIARKYHALDKYESIYQLNEDSYLTNQDIDLIEIGQHLAIPYRLKNGKKIFADISKEELTNLILKGKYTCRGKCDAERINSIISHKKTINQTKQTNDLVGVTNQIIVNLKDSVERMDKVLDETYQTVESLHIMADKRAELKNGLIEVDDEIPNDELGSDLSNNELEKKIEKEFPAQLPGKTASIPDETMFEPAKRWNTSIFADLGAMPGIGIIVDNEINYYTKDRLGIYAKINSKKRTNNQSQTWVDRQIMPSGLGYSVNTIELTTKDEFVYGPEMGGAYSHKFTPNIFGGLFVGGIFQKHTTTTSEKDSVCLEVNNVCINEGSAYKSIEEADKKIILTASAQISYNLKDISRYLKNTSVGAAYNTRPKDKSGKKSELLARVTMRF